MKSLACLAFLLVADPASAHDLSRCKLSVRAVLPNGQLSINDLIRPEHVVSVQRMEPNYPGNEPWFLTFNGPGKERILDFTYHNPASQLAVLCNAKRFGALTLLSQ